MDTPRLTRTIDPEVAHLRGRTAALTRAGRLAEARIARRDSHARQLVLAAQRAASHGLTDEQIDQVVAALKGEAA